MPWKEKVLPNPRRGRRRWSFASKIEKASHRKGCLTCASFYEALAMLLGEAVFNLGASGKFKTFEDALRAVSKKGHKYRGLMKPLRGSL